MTNWKCSRALVIAIGLAGAALRAADPFPEETAFRATYDAATVALSGRVVESSGAPLAGVVVHVAAGSAAVTAADGTFTLAGLSRSNQLLTVTAAGYYSHVQPVQLFVPLTQTNVVLPPLVLWPETPSVVRFLFGGDTAFARRMLDPQETTPRDQMPIEDPDALISVSDPLPGTLDVVSFVKPLFLSVDYPVLNFESVVTLNPSTPHWQKAFVYFSLPASLPALRDLNVDYVGLGNNHVYDYLELGVADTRLYLGEAGIHFSGLGSNSAAAFAPYRTHIKDTPYSFLAMTSIGGEQHVTNYVASYHKGGAAYIEAKLESSQAVSTERASGFATILQTHIGDEYTYEPSANALNWMRFGVEAGADLAVAHHPHIAQGFGMHRGVLLIHSLGNLFFDQDRLETMVGLLATVDMEGRRLRRAWGTPVYLEDYRPRLMAGRVAPVVMRRIGEFSQQLRVFPYHDQAWLASRPSQYSFADRRMELPVVIGTNGWTVLDLRNVASPEESLMRIEADSPGLFVRPGRDLMNFGDFEDVDVDADRGEASRWDFNTNTTVALQGPYRGNAALCIYRKSSFTSEGVASFRNRVRVMGDARNTPNKDLSLLGYVRGQAAGRIKIVTRYYASEGDLEFGEEVALDHPGGTFAWQLFTQDLHMPPDDPLRWSDPPAENARAVRVFLRHAPPAAGMGYAWFDEIAVVNWEETLDPMAGPALDTPHARDFLRVQGSSGTHRLALTFRRYRPAEADGGHGPDLVLETEQADQSADHLGFKTTAVGFDTALRLVVRNRGNQALVVGSLACVGGDQSDFSARWLTLDGSVEAGPVLAIPAQAGALLEVRFAPTSAGFRESVVKFQSNDPDEAQSLVKVGVSGVAYENSPVRFIRRNRTLAPVVCVQIPSDTNATNLLVEQLPVGLTPANFGDSGVWDAASRTLRWRNVGGRSSVSYSLIGNSNVYSISGWIESVANHISTAGESVVMMLASSDADGDGLPDWWEQKFFDDRTVAMSEVDSDGDGQTNQAEFLAGTHPLSGGFQAQKWAPYLRLSLDDHFANLQVFGFEGASYRVEQSADLQTWLPAFSNVLVGQTVTLPRANLPSATSRFFRAVVEER